MDPTYARTHDPDEWLETAPPFSRPLAARMRDWIQRCQPDLTESIKWNNLCYTGRKLVCGLSACKKHLGIFFFRGTELPDPHHLLSGQETNTSMAGIKITTLDGLNLHALANILQAAVDLDADPSIPLPPRQKREPLPIPDFFAKALKKERAAAKGFEALSPTCQREYIVWLSSAKRPETREKRLQETLAALAKGRKWIERKG